MSASYEVKGSIAVITLNNPPVNGLGHATRTGIFDGLKQAMADKAVKAVVITGGGKAFANHMSTVETANIVSCFANPVWS